jgi:hypothetical protein
MNRNWQLTELINTKNEIQLHKLLKTMEVKGK